MDNSDFSWFTDGFYLKEQYWARDVIIASFDVVEAVSLPMAT